jgi:hypothetical protein
VSFRASFFFVIVTHLSSGRDDSLVPWPHGHVHDALAAAVFRRLGMDAFEHLLEHVDFMLSAIDPGFDLHAP